MLNPKDVLWVASSSSFAALGAQNIQLNRKLIEATSALATLSIELKNLTPDPEQKPNAVTIAANVFMWRSSDKQAGILGTLPLGTPVIATGLAKDGMLQLRSRPVIGDSSVTVWVLATEVSLVGK